MLPEDMKVNNRVSVVVESLEFESEILIIKEEYILLNNGLYDINFILHSNLII